MKPQKAAGEGQRVSFREESESGGTPDYFSLVWQAKDLRAGTL